MADEFRQDSTQGWVTGLSIPARFEEVAERHASLEAVRSPQRTFTYRELEANSRRLAGFLYHKLGREPNPVALLMEDGVQVVSSLLGVIRAGHFYCALSHRDPPLRLVRILQDLEVRLLIVDRQTLGLAQQIAPPGCELLMLPDIPETDEMPLPTRFDPKTLLGIFYTSGSTGEPKGVLRNHGYVLHRLWVEVQGGAIGPGDRLLALRQFNVSASLGCIFDALLTGATLVLYDAGALGIGPLAELLRKEQITMLFPPIELLRLFMDSLDKDAFFVGIRSVFVGGDVLFRRDVERLRPHLSEKAVVVYSFSSSETGLLSRTTLHNNSPIAADIVPVGFPVPGKEVLILDQDGKVLRAGTPGEIAVRSEIIFPGYWHQPELTAGKFRSDPADPRRKVFCTGDLGYLLSDGQLVFLGRNDFRVKIHGYSVDLSSVECALMADPQVKRAVVVPQVDPAGLKRLVAYVVLAPHATATAANLRSFLLDHIPAYMVPSVFIFLTELPLTVTMKVDRKALVPPDWSQVQTSIEYALPRDEVERKLVKIWQQVLGVERIGIDDGFFDVGGDSLLASSLFLEIERNFSVRLPLRTLIDHETIRQIASLIQYPQKTNMDILVALSTRGNGVPVFLIPFGKGDLLGLVRLGQLLEGRQPIYGLQAAGVGGNNLYKNTVEETAAQFVQAIRTVQPSGPYRLIGGSVGGMVAYEMALVLREAGETVGLLGMIDTIPPGPRPNARLINRIRIHWEKFLSQPVKKYPEYFLDRWKGLLVNLARVKFFRKLFMIKISGSPSQAGAASRHLERVAHALYAPRDYSGETVIFKAKDRPWYVDWDPMAGWTKYIKGKITVVEVDGTHGQVYSEPYVAGLAKAINTFLE